jgi:hypothetical protein
LECIIIVCIFVYTKQINEMKKFEDGSVMYEPYERLTYLERIQDLFKLLSILPSLIFKRNDNN